MDAFESVADNDGFEEVEGPAEIVEPASASAPAPKEATPEPEPAPKEATPAPKESTPAPKEATPAPKEATPAPKESPDSGKTILGRSEKQRRVDAARAEQLRKLKERYNVEFANIQKKRPKPKAYNAASVLSAPDPEAKIKQILARDRAIYNEKQTRKGVKGTAKDNVKANAVNKGNVKANATANGPRVNTRKRNAPSILSSTRSAAAEIKEKARADLKALKESAEKELREIGANVSILHPIFTKAEPHKAEPHKAEPHRAEPHRAEHKSAPKSRSRTRVRSLPARLNQMTRNNN
jgi:hypothetical protein